MKGMYVHNFSDLAERSPAELAATLGLGGVGEVRFKTHQWLSWNGAPKAAGYDRARYAVRDLDGVVALRDVFADAGIRCTPWCVPMGLDVEAEAQLAAQVAGVCGRLDLDVEPYAEFWPGLAKGDYSAVVPFFQRLRQLVGERVELTLDFPCRSYAWEWGVMRTVVELAAPYVDRLALQSYFGLVEARAAELRVRQVSALPIDHIGDVGHLAEMVALWQGASRALVWSAPQMTRGLYQVLAGLETLPEAPGGPDAPPGPPEAVEWQEPGFAALAASYGALMGSPSAAPYADSQGNVWQASAGGYALWVKALNRNYWLGADGEVRGL